MVRLLVKNLCRLPWSDACEELEVLSISVVSVFQFHWQHRAVDTAKDRPLTPHSIVTLTRVERSHQSMWTLHNGRDISSYQVPIVSSLATHKITGYPAKCMACKGPHSSNGHGVSMNEAL